MRVEFAKFRQTLNGNLEVTEVAYAGNINGSEGVIKFSDGTIAAEKTDKGARVNLSGLREAGLFHWKNLRRTKEVHLGRDGGGCVQIDRDWMLVVHERGSSGIYDRLRRDRGGYHRESYWH